MSVVHQDNVSTVGDLLNHLGVPARRVLLDPTPGTATVRDLLRSDRVVELIDGVLVEKAMGWYESLLASVLIYHLQAFNRVHRLGIILGDQAPMRVKPRQVRLPDVAFCSWSHFPGRKLPKGQVLDFVADLAVEILSPGNTKKEMRRKRRELFAGGATLIWEVHPKKRQVAVYTAPETCTILGEDAALVGEPVLPGFRLKVRDWFAEAGERA